MVLETSGLIREWVLVSRLLVSCRTQQCRTSARWFKRDGAPRAGPYESDEEYSDRVASEAGTQDSGGGCGERRMSSTNDGSEAEGCT